MSLIRRKPAEKVTLISLNQAAEMLNLHESTIRKGCAGTERLTRVRQGLGQRRRISLIREEVEDHIQSLVEHARQSQQRTDNTVKYLRGDHPTLSKDEIKSIIEPYQNKTDTAQSERKKRGRSD